MRLHKKIVLITGGSSGIGLEMARQLLLRENTVLITSRSAERLQAAKNSLPEIHTFVSDTGDPDSISRLFADVESRFPGLDVLINNAGIMHSLNLQEPADPSLMSREMTTNFCGPLWMTTRFLSLLKTRPEAAIVNVSSCLAFLPLAGFPVYCASKAALHSLTLSLRKQLADTKISVFELAPPAVDTPLLHGAFQSSVQSIPAMAVEKLVASAISGIQSGNLEICPGQSKLMKVLAPLAPGLVGAWMNKITRPNPGRG